MAGMSTASGSTDLSDYRSRRVTIKVSGGSDSKTSKYAVSTVTVSYSCLSDTVQSIHRRGGQIMSVSMGGANNDSVGDDAPADDSSDGDAPSDE